MLIKLGQLCTVIEKDLFLKDQLEDLTVDLTGYEDAYTVLHKYKQVTIKSTYSRTNSFIVCTKYSCQTIVYYDNANWSADLADALGIPRKQPIVSDQCTRCIRLTKKGLPCRRIASVGSSYCYQHGA